MVTAAKLDGEILDKPPAGYIRLAEAASRLGMTPSGVQYRVEQGKLGGAKVRNQRSRSGWEMWVRESDLQNTRPSQRAPKPTTIRKPEQQKNGLSLVGPTPSENGARQSSVGPTPNHATGQHQPNGSGDGVFYQPSRISSTKPQSIDVVSANTLEAQTFTCRRCMKELTASQTFGASPGYEHPELVGPLCASCLKKQEAQVTALRPQAASDFSRLTPDFSRSASDFSRSTYPPEQPPAGTGFIPAIQSGEAHTRPMGVEVKADPFQQVSAMPPDTSGDMMAFVSALMESRGLQPIDLVREFVPDVPSLISLAEDRYQHRGKALGWLAQAVLTATPQQADTGLADEVRRLTASADAAWAARDLALDRHATLQNRLQDAENNLTRSKEQVSALKEQLSQQAVAREADNRLLTAANTKAQQHEQAASRLTREKGELEQLLKMAEQERDAARNKLKQEQARLKELQAEYDEFKRLAKAVTSGGPDSAPPTLRKGVDPIMRGMEAEDLVNGAGAPIRSPEGRILLSGAQLSGLKLVLMPGFHPSNQSIVVHNPEDVEKVLTNLEGEGSGQASTAANWIRRNPELYKEGLSVGFQERNKPASIFYPKKKGGQ